MQPRKVLEGVAIAGVPASPAAIAGRVLDGIFVACAGFACGVLIIPAVLLVVMLAFRAAASETALEEARG